MLSAQDIDLRDFKKRCLLYSTQKEKAFDGLKLTADIVNYRFPQENGRTLISIAAIQGAASAVKALLSIEGADPNIADYDNKTPLMLAATLSYQVVVVLLASSKTNPSLLDNAGRNAYDYAEKMEISCIMDLLKPWQQGESLDQKSKMVLGIMS